MKIETILVPPDFSEDAYQAAEAAVEFAKRFDARIVLLHAYHVTVPIATPMGGGYALPPGFYDQLREQATAQIESAAKQLAESGVKVTGIASSEPASIAITSEAERLPADLIVMGTRGLTGLKHVALGSAAERVVRTARCPVMVVKSKS